MTATAELVTLQERITLTSASRVDEARSRITGVKVLGENSANARRYPADTRRRARGMIEGAKVNVNHPDRPGDRTPLESRFGWLENVQERSDGTYADLHYNPQHPLARTVAWWAKNNPTALGMSINAEGRGRQERGVFVVEEIVGINSVDLVADPATTGGLFESRGGAARQPAASFDLQEARAVASTFRQRTAAVANCNRLSKQQSLVRFLRGGNPGYLREAKEPYNGSLQPAGSAGAEPDPFSQAAKALADILDRLAAGERPKAGDFQTLRGIVTLLQSEADEAPDDVKESRRMMARVAHKLLAGQQVTRLDLLRNQQDRLALLRNGR